MTLGLAFWIVMLIWFIFGLWSNWPATGGPKAWGNHFLLFFLFFLLGWRVFGPPLHN